MRIQQMVITLFLWIATVTSLPRRERNMCVILRCNAFNRSALAYGESSSLQPSLVSALGCVPRNKEKHSLGTYVKKFSIDLCEACDEEHVNNNFITSPLSIFLPLSTIAYGANGETACQMKNSLHLPHQYSFEELGFPQLLHSLNSVKGNNFKIANKVYTHQTLSIKEEFRHITDNLFYSNTDLIDFSKKTNDATIINTSIKTRTKNRINNVFKHDDLEDDDVVILTNTIQFNGKWKKQYSIPNSRGDIDVEPYAEVEGKIIHGEFEAVEATYHVMSYKGGEFNMILIVPYGKFTIYRIEKYLKNVNISKLLDESPSDISLKLPLFRIESVQQLKVPLQQLGMRDMFEDIADFSGISDHPLKTVKVTQKVMLEVTRKGSTAAVASEVRFGAESGNTASFVKSQQDQPFICWLVWKDVILFQVSVDQPYWS